MPAKKSNKQEKILHARIQNPLLIRKTLLESAITSAEILKSHSLLRKIRSEKNKRKTELKKIFDEIKSLKNKLEEHELPPLNRVTHEKVKKTVPKKKLIKQEKGKRKKQEQI